MSTVDITDLNYNGILKDINLSFSGKRVIGIVGPNGSGKTTLLRHIYRDIKTRGTVFFDNTDVAQFSVKSLARNISVLTQFNDQVEGKLAIEEIVVMGRMPYKKHYVDYRDRDFVIADNYMTLFGLQKMKNKEYHALSGGEKQRVMLAKCFSQETDIMILDEPTNHLDIRYKVEVMKALAASESTVIMTIHDINLSAKYCQHLILMNDGQIYAQGTPAEVLTRKCLFDVFGVEFTVLPVEDRVAIFL